MPNPDFSLSINLFFRLLAAVSRISVFLLTCAAEKLLVSENRLASGFQGHVGGIGGSRVQSENLLDFRRAAFPPREWRLCRHSQIGIGLLPNPDLSLSVTAAAARKVYGYRNSN